MTVAKPSVSALGNEIVNQIADFIEANMKAMSSGGEVTAQDGADAMGHAIAFGICKALNSPTAITAIDAAAVLPVGGPLVPPPPPLIKTPTLEV